MGRLPVGARDARTGAALDQTAQTQASGQALTQLLARLTQRSVVFLRNSSHGDRRHGERVPCKAPGRLSLGGVVIPVFTLDLSRGGCVLAPLGRDAMAGAKPGALARLELEGVGVLAVTLLAVTELGWHARFDDIGALAAERIARLIVHMRGASTAAVALAQATAAEIARLFGAGLDTGEITLDDLITNDYHPIPGADPAQYTTPASLYYDRVLPPALEASRRAPPQPMFALATDRNAYAPVHHPEFSQAQRPGEPVWNDLNARNRRIYDRWLTLTGARNRAPYSLRAYIRHRADGTAQPIQVIAAPIFVRGEFWGNVQLGCAL